MPETLEKLRSELISEVHKLRNILEDKLDSREKQILNEVEKRMNDKVSKYIKKEDGDDRYVSHREFNEFIKQWKFTFGLATTVLGTILSIVGAILGIMWTTIEKNAEIQIEYYTEVRAELSELNGRLEPFDFSIIE